MAWSPVIENGDTVTTPHGTGVVRAISEANNSAQVEVGGQLFDVPLPETTKAKEGEDFGDKPVPTQVQSHLVQKGDRIQRRERPTSKGTVTEVTQRTVRVKWDANGSISHFTKREVQKHLDYEQSGQPEAKVGDKVRVIQENGGAPKVGDVGKIVKISTSGRITIITADFPNHSGWEGMMGEHLELVKEEQKPGTPERTKEGMEQKAQDVSDGMYGLLNLKKKLEDKIEQEVDDELKELRELAKQNQKLEVKVGDKVNVIAGLKHKQLEQLITYAAMRLHPLLVGMAGTGKTHAGQQTAEALGLPFYAMSVGAQTSKSDIIGYQDASGRYVRTHFRDAYEKGGVFLMDEIDAGNANVLIQINAALSNGLCAFPDKMVTRHEDFVFIASANTFGNGANRQYVGRNQLDAATLDRFALIEWFIDDELEANLAVGLNGKAWYMAVRAARDYVAEKNIRALVSPRATQKGSKLLDVGQGLEEVIHATLLGSVPEDKKPDVIQVATTIFNKFASEVPSKLSKKVNPEVGDLLKDVPF